MINNGQCYIWIPSELTLSRLTDKSAILINSVHSSINKSTRQNLKTDYTAGQTHEYYLALNDIAMGGAPFTRDAEPGLASCGPIRNLDYLDTKYVPLIVAFGGDVEGFPVFFELSDLDGEVPQSFPCRTYLDVDGIDKVHTWGSWGVDGESHKPVRIDDKWYRSSAYGASGTQLHASHWVGQTNSDFRVLSIREYLNIQSTILLQPTEQPS